MSWFVFIGAPPRTNFLIHWKSEIFITFVFTKSKNDYHGIHFTLFFSTIKNNIPNYNASFMVYHFWYRYRHEQLSLNATKIDLYLNRIGDSIQNKQRSPHQTHILNRHHCVIYSSLLTKSNFIRIFILRSKVASCCCIMNASYHINFTYFSVLPCCCSYIPFVVIIKVTVVDDALTVFVWQL